MRYTGIGVNMMKISQFFQTDTTPNKYSLLRVLLDYFFAISIPLLTLVVILFVDPAFDRTTFSLLFFLIIALNAWNGGYKPGIVSTVLSVIIIEYFFIPPYKSFIIVQPAALLQLALFLLEGIFLSMLIDTKKHPDTIFSYLRREKEYKKKISEIEAINQAQAKEIRSRDEFLSIASHELKTPLTSMLLQTQTALHNIRSVSLAQFSIESLLKMLESVENQTKRLSKMINDLLSISLITTGNLQLEREQVDLDKVIEGVLIDFSSRIERENYTVIYDTHESIVGYWDELRLQQAIANFLSNALKYGNRKPIEIILRKRNNQAEFMIKDNGIGISKENQKRIFGLFERGVSPDEYKGLGVGLHITHEIVKAHAGVIAVSSILGRGTLFIMKLPLQTD